MMFSFGVLLILGGLAIMGFGLLIFYAWLPLLYGLLGFEVGFLIGKWLTGDVGVVAITLGLALAVATAGVAYFLEPYRRILLGFTGGVVFALAIASVLGLDRLITGVSGFVLAMIGGVLGATVALKYFDLLIVASTAVGGAALVVTGAQLLLPTATVHSTSFLPALITVVLAVFGTRWQLSNLAKWVPVESAHEREYENAIGTQADLRKP